MEGVGTIAGTVKIHSPKFAPPAVGSGVVRLTGRVRKPRPRFVSFVWRVRTRVFCVRKRSGRSQTSLCHFGFARFV